MIGFTGLRNLAIAVTALLAVNRLCKRRAAAPLVTDTAPTPATAPEPEHQTEMWLRTESGELASFADHLYGMADLAGSEMDLENDLSDGPFVRLDDLRWLLGNYVIRGARVRRLIELPQLLKTTAEIGQLGADSDLRTTASVLLQRIRESNSVTADWLLVHHVAIPDPDFLDSNALLDRYSRLQVEPVAVAGDPLYLLTCHIHDVLDTAELLDDAEHPSLLRLEAQLTKPLAAIERELSAAMAFNNALLGRRSESRPAKAA